MIDFKNEITTKMAIYCVYHPSKGNMLRPGAGASPRFDHRMQGAGRAAGGAGNHRRPWRWARISRTTRPGT